MSRKCVGSSMGKVPVFTCGNQTIWFRVRWHPEAKPSTSFLSDDSTTNSLHVKKIYRAEHEKSRPKAAFPVRSLQPEGLLVLCSLPR